MAVPVMQLFGKAPYVAFFSGQSWNAKWWRRDSKFSARPPRLARQGRAAISRGEETVRRSRAGTPSTFA